MTITVYRDLIQGSDEWLEARRGLLTASEMGKIITPTLKMADNDTARAHVYEIAAQRISKYVDPSYLGDDMLRGHEDEIDARELYREKYSEVDVPGFITNDKWGFTIGYSPDGLIREDGAIEIKSRKQAHHVKTLSEHCVPKEHIMQCQTALLVSERSWIDYISYSAGLEMGVIRVEPDPDIQAGIIKAATAFEEKVQGAIDSYRANVALHQFWPTERRVEREMRL